MAPYFEVGSTTVCRAHAAINSTGILCIFQLDCCISAMLHIQTLEETFKILGLVIVTMDGLVVGS